MFGKSYRETPKSEIPAIPEVQPFPESSPETVEAMDKIFISHSSKDVAFVEELIEIIKLMGLPKKFIFCTSLPNNNIKHGENFLNRIKKELKGNALVIFILTDNFYASKMCMCEMGATWALTKVYIPILIPPFDFHDITHPISLAQGFKINDKLELNRFKKNIQKYFRSYLTKHLSDQVREDLDLHWEKDRNPIIDRINLQIKRVESEIPDKVKYIKYGDVVRIRHIETRHYLNSQDKYFRAHQQEVAAYGNKHDNNLWIVKGAHGKAAWYEAGKFVKNRDIIRLEHYRTSKNLHSHAQHSAPVTTDQQEVTAYGKNGVGDGNDDWKIELNNDDSDIWQIDQKFRLIHCLTGKTLYSHEKNLKEEQNLHEVTCFYGRDKQLNEYWEVVAIS